MSDYVIIGSGSARAGTNAATIMIPENGAALVASRARDPA